jgi:phage shock protein PspC (stress-responsive transcriptional regulator)
MTDNPKNRDDETPPRDEAAHDEAPPRDQNGETEPMGETPKGGGWERLAPGGEPAVRKLTRSTSDKLIGGVAGGLGRYFGVDPILFRIAFVVLMFAGGVGILAYIALLAFVPADDGTSTIGRGSGANVAGVILLVLLAVVVFGPPAFFLGPVLVPIAIVLGVGVLLWRAAGGTLGAGDPGKLAARGAIAFLIGLAGIGAFVGVFLLAAIGGGTVLTILAIVAGMALVVAAFAGGARWLIVPALVLVLPLAIVVAAGIEVDGGAGERHYRVAEASELRPDYRLGMGELEVDLRDVTLPPGTTSTRVKVGVGHAVVRVPEDACVTSDVQIGVGHAQVLDRSSDGVDVAFAQTAASDAPRLHLDADIGIGALEVVRGNDPLYSRGYRSLSQTLPACPA